MCRHALHIGREYRLEIHWRAVGTQQNDNYCVPTAR
jgi:hypothetical protein